MTTDSVESKAEEVQKTEEPSGDGAQDDVKTETKEVQEVATADTPEKVDKEEEHYDPFYPPIVSLPLVEVRPGEEGEVEVFKRRAKLYRYASESEPPEWKERGTGDVRIMKREEAQSARILMRREKTLKVCANHHITPWMDMRPNCGNKKAWVWKTQADFADEEPKQETLAIKFGNEANSQKFFEAFEEMRKYVLKVEAKRIQEEEARTNVCPAAAEGGDKGRSRRSGQDWSFGYEGRETGCSAASGLPARAHRKMRKQAGQSQARFSRARAPCGETALLWPRLSAASTRIL